MDTGSFEQIQSFIREIKDYNNIEKIVSELRKKNEFFEWSDWDIEDQLILQSLKFLKQEKVLKLAISHKSLLQQLKEIQFFYQDQGGLLGYQNLVSKHLKDEKQILEEIFCPPVETITNRTSFIEEAIDLSIEMLPKFCEIYVVGGAADRLGFFDKETQEPLPAAEFHFLGKPLLKFLVDDLEAKEFLYFQKFGKRIFTQIGLMTSDETSNDSRIKNLLARYHYFGRPKESFFFIRQPMVPVVDISGKWIVEEALQLKPSGHGALWQAALKQSILKRLHQEGIEYGLIRQINNPIIGLDYNVLAFQGIGLFKKKKFGFFVTKRLEGQPEGAIVLKKKQDGFCITNIEYCQAKTETIHSQFPSNTNLLFVDLKAIEEAVKKNPYPGSLLNFKTKDSKSKARLELTMQNIAEEFIDSAMNEKEEHKDVFLVLQERSKAISTIKKLKNENLEELETPKRALFDLSLQIDLLLRKQCSFVLPEFSKSLDDFFKSPPYLFFYHPVLGPTFKEIVKKLKNWQIGKGAYISLEIAQFFGQNVGLNGGLEVISKEFYTSSCRLENVAIFNRGVCNELTDVGYLNFEKKAQAMKIILGKNSHFIAKNCTFEGVHEIIVADHTTYCYLENQLVIQLKR